MTDETQVTLMRNELNHAIQHLKNAQGHMGRRLKSDMNKMYWKWWTHKVDQILSDMEDLA